MKELSTRLKATLGGFIKMKIPHQSYFDYLTKYVSVGMVCFKIS